MRNRIIVLALMFANFISYSFVSAQCYNTKNVYWEQISDKAKEETLALVVVDADVVNYYKGNFKFTDNEKSYRLLDILTSMPQGSNIKALYFHIFNICIKSDGAVSEMLGKYCQKVLVNDPAYVLTCFSRHDSLIKQYGLLLGYELYFKEEGVSDIEYNFSDFKKLIFGKIENNANLKQTFVDLNSEIEKVMKNMD